MTFETKDFSVEIKADVDKGLIEAYASTWEVDQGNDRIVKGAYAKTIKERFRPGGGSDIKVLWQHDIHQPIGVPTHMEEDSKGLYTISKLSKTPRGLEALELARDGVVDKLSIGYDSIKDHVSKSGERILEELKLFEYSIVTFPMNMGASILSAKEAAFFGGMANRFGHANITSFLKSEGGRPMDNEELLAGLKEVYGSLGKILEKAGQAPAASKGQTEPPATSTKDDDEEINALLLKAQEMNKNL